MTTKRMGMVSLRLLLNKVDEEHNKTELYAPTVHHLMVNSHYHCSFNALYPICMLS